MKIKVGVIGSAGGEMPSGVRDKARELGRALASPECIIVTGACPGLPHEAVLGAKEIGCLAVGISPALSLDQHRDLYHSPWEEYDVIVYAGSGLMGREVEVIRTCDAVVVISGRSGTLGEFAIAYDEARLIGVLAGTGGIADAVPMLLEVINKDTGAEVVMDDDPQRLVTKMVAKHEERVEKGVAFRGPIIHEG